MSFIYNQDRTIDGENTLTTDILNCNLDLEVEGEKGSADQFLHKNAATNVLEWAFVPEQDTIQAGAHLSLSDGVMNCDLVEDDTILDGFKKNYIIIDGEKITLNLLFNNGIVLTTTSPSDNPVHTIRCALVSDTTPKEKGISIAGGHIVGLDIAGLPAVTTLDITGDNLTKLIVQKYSTTHQRWENSSINADKLSDAIYVPYVAGDGITISSTTITNSAPGKTITGTGLIQVVTGGTPAAPTAAISSLLNTISSDITISGTGTIQTKYVFSSEHISTETDAQGNYVVKSNFEAGSNITFTGTNNNTINADLSGLTFSQPAYVVTTDTGYIRPATTGKGTLGDSNHKFNKLFVNNTTGFVMDGALHTSDVFITNLKGVESVVGGETLVADISINANLTPVGSVSVGNNTNEFSNIHSETTTTQNLSGKPYSDAGEDAIHDIIYNCNLIPLGDGAKQIGNVDKNVSDIYVNNIHTSQISAFNVSGDIIPSAHSQHDLGSTTKKFSHVYATSLTATNIYGYNLAGHITVLSDETINIGTASHKLLHTHSKNVTATTITGSLGYIAELDCRYSTNPGDNHYNKYGGWRVGSTIRYKSVANVAGVYSATVFDDFNGDTGVYRQHTNGAATPTGRINSVSGVYERFTGTQTNPTVRIDSVNGLYERFTGTQTSPSLSITASNGNISMKRLATGTDGSTYYTEVFTYTGSTGKFTFFQDNGDDDGGHYDIFTIDPTKSTNDAGSLTSSPINFNVNRMPQHSKHADLQDGDLFRYHTGGSGNDFDYLCIKSTQ